MSGRPQTALQPVGEHHTVAEPARVACRCTEKVEDKKAHGLHSSLLLREPIRL